MQNLYDGVLAFKGRWRSYQERVLREADRYLADHKIHIVAAPGSGKTTLGIELIRRLGQPCLILSPSITIRQQWLERIEEGFLLDGCRREELLSNDLRNSRPITAITYQALYSAMKQYRGQLNGSRRSASMMRLRMKRNRKRPQKRKLWIFRTSIFLRRLRRRGSKPSVWMKPIIFGASGGRHWKPL